MAEHGFARLAKHNVCSKATGLVRNVQLHVVSLPLDGTQYQSLPESYDTNTLPNCVPVAFSRCTTTPTLGSGLVLRIWKLTVTPRGRRTIGNLINQSTGGTFARQ